MDNHSVTYLPIKEFRRLGYLQELNRQFLHPLGLALAATIDQNGEEWLSGVWDYRSDPEGIRFAELDEEKTTHICLEQKERAKTRKAALGYVIQPAPCTKGAQP